MSAGTLHPTATAHPGLAAQQVARRRAVSSTIAFVTAVVALWAVLGYLGSLADTLSRVSSLNDRLKTQMADSNTGLAQLEQATARIQPLATDSGTLAESLGAINGDLSAMQDGARNIATTMIGVDQSLENLGTRIDDVDTTNGKVGKQLEGISASLDGQAAQVGTLRSKLRQTRTGLGVLPGQIGATNARLAYVNRVVCQMGQDGVRNQLALRMTFLGIPTGQAMIYATMIPPGGWRC